jgi:hypothetical protein
VQEEVRKAYRKIFGKPRLSDEECDRLSNGPILSQDEMEVIRAYWRMCKPIM